MSREDGSRGAVGATGTRERASRLLSPQLMAELGRGERLGNENCTAPGCGFPVWARGLCSKHLKQWQRGKDPFIEPDLNLLPEDGIIDDVAIEAAISGVPRITGEPLRLTQREREIAGAMILARGGSEDTLRARLYMPSARVARELIERIANPHGDTGELIAA